MGFALVGFRTLEYFFQQIRLFFDDRWSVSNQPPNFVFVFFLFATAQMATAKFAEDIEAVVISDVRYSSPERIERTFPMSPRFFLSY